MSISSFFYNKSSLVVAFISTVVVFAYLFLIFIDKSKCFETADSSVKSLGTSFGFSYEMVNKFFLARSEDMLICYKVFNRIWDNIFALLYGSMYTIWLSYLLQPWSSKTKFINLLPFVQTIFDYLENFKLGQITQSFLDQNDLSVSAVQWASSFSMIKWICSFLVFLLVIIGTVFRVKSFLKR